ncbi:LysR family transcriptional regulator [Kluyvera ascorbata]|uniref:LysR family transcriptional regulator n=1 Tax=Kluyvera ascorbata TaxID=51288 RepID=UPI0022E248F9|nr:LysR family transcriptional regulator [Kluyvera ascorbata]MEB6388401.1 LysR family transcriptional regulator [Kluyvera ascorbata]HDG1699556.1 LysR family transcriptional regulator [Kluyvera ascorbata]HED1310509.1 LysR family transcriptional regulator [Kluyvera ascorbata]HED3067490.1 LysR family transcriptional regulator [Kluyvera ascorbata]
MINFRIIRHMWLFLAVAEEKHFGRAAKRLGMTQPPLTQQIQVLEQSLKVQLFDRSKRNVQLTPVGLAILPAVKRFAEQVERLELAVNEAVAGHTGMLTIGAISTAMLDVLPPLIDKMKARYPDIVISIKEIDSAEAVLALQNGEIDLAFARLTGEMGEGITLLPLSSAELVVALPRQHRLAGESQIVLRDLMQEEWVMFSRHLSPVYFDSITTACRNEGFSPRIIHHVRSVSSQIAFVGCGQGIALVPDSLERLSPANVVTVPLDQTIEVITTAVAWSASRKNPLADKFIALIQTPEVG